MAETFDPTDPNSMTPEQQVAEIAQILGAGILRLHRRAALPTPGILSDSALDRLADGAKRRLHGHRG